MQTTGQGLIRCFYGVDGRHDTTQVNHLGLGRVTQAGIGAALETHFDPARGVGRDLQLQALAIDLLITKELIAVGLTLG
ncbi:hypothetical protein D3C80_1791590 [compost metagenome]